MEKTKKKRGRPFKPPEEKRDSVLYLKLTADERALVDKASGDAKPTIWAREALLRAAKRKG